MHFTEAILLGFALAMDCFKDANGETVFTYESKKLDFENISYLDLDDIAFRYFSRWDDRIGLVCQYTF